MTRVCRPRKDSTSTTTGIRASSTATMTAIGSMSSCTNELTMSRRSTKPTVSANGSGQAKDTSETVFHQAHTAARLKPAA